MIPKRERGPVYFTLMLLAVYAAALYNQEYPMWLRSLIALPPALAAGWWALVEAYNN